MVRAYSRNHAHLGSFHSLNKPTKLPCRPAPPPPQSLTFTPQVGLKILYNKTCYIRLNIGPVFMQNIKDKVGTKVLVLLSI